MRIINRALNLGTRKPKQNFCHMIWQAHTVHRMATQIVPSKPFSVSRPCSVGVLGVRAKECGTSFTGSPGLKMAVLRLGSLLQASFMLILLFIFAECTIFILDD
jgi:hypothetical protein